MSSHPHAALFTSHSYTAPLSPPSLTPNDKRQKAESSRSAPQSLHLMCTNAICLGASRGPRWRGDAYRKSCREEAAPRQEPAGGAGPRLAPSPTLAKPLGPGFLSGIQMAGRKGFPQVFKSCPCSYRNPFDALCLTPQVSSDAPPAAERTPSFLKPQHLEPKQPQRLAGHSQAGLQVHSICCWQRFPGSKRFFSARSRDKPCCKESRGALH